MLGYTETEVENMIKELIYVRESIERNDVLTQAIDLLQGLLEEGRV